MITRINTVSVFVTDQDRSRAFYADQLGFEVLMDAPMGQGRWIQLAPPGAATSLVLMKPTQDMPADVYARSTSLIGGFTNFIFAVDDIQATYDALSARGVEFADMPSQQPWGWWATIKDPDGNLIGLHQ
jgi:lactoylglutathione lyase